MAVGDPRGHLARMPLVSHRVSAGAITEKDPAPPSARTSPASRERACNILVEITPDAVNGRSCKTVIQSRQPIELRWNGSGRRGHSPFDLAGPEGRNPVLTRVGHTRRMEQTPSLSPQNLADALGEVRAEIRTLKAREAALRRALLDVRPNGPVTGAHYEVSVRETRRRVLDRNRLPDSILGDDRFWTTSLSRTVVTRARSATGAAQSRPPQGGAAPPNTLPGRQPTLDLWGQESELVLVEDF